MLVTLFLLIIALVALAILLRSHLSLQKKHRAVAKQIEALQAIQLRSESETNPLDSFTKRIIRGKESFSGLSGEQFKNMKDLALRTKDSIQFSSEISSNIRIVNSEIISLSSAIEEASASMNEISQTIGNFEGLIDNQVSAITQTSSSIEEMNNSIQNIEGIVEDKQRLVSGLLDQTKTGEKQAAITNELIDKIAVNVQSINDVIAVIDNIAAQTNLLAMNAAIEAAHAGNAGRGFAVVANEIKKLAESSSTNSNKINLNLKTIIASIAQVQKESRLNLDSNELIEKDAQALGLAMDEIHESTRDLATGSREINKAIAAIVQVSQELQNGSGEITIGAKEANQGLLLIQQAGNTTKENVGMVTQHLSKINSTFISLTEAAIAQGDACKKIIDQYSTMLGMQQSGINLPVVILQHILWVVRSRAFIDETLNLNAIELGDHRACALGKWLDTEEAAAFYTHKAWKVLLAEHKTLHTTVREIVEHKTQWTVAQLEEHFSTLIEQSKVVVRLLLELFDYEDL
ncbi:hypothetical protein MASR2M78_34610 [Treponema sp.]